MPLKELLRDGATSIDARLSPSARPVMMKFCAADTTRPFGVKTIVSLNTIMVDGTGMCGGCRVTVGGKTQFTCVDGPEFDAHQVDFDELLARGRIYAPEEGTARETEHMKDGVPLCLARK